MIASWAAEEMATARFGDNRLDARVVHVLSNLGSRPNLSIPAACGGKAEMAAAYRFFDNDKVDFEKVLGPHCAQTRARAAQQPIVLLVQDTTEIDLTRPNQQVTGVGELDGSRRGVLTHVLQAFTVDAVPLGTIWAANINRVDGVSHASEAEKAHERKHTPIEDKESVRWLEGFRAARGLAQQHPDTQFVCIGDSESDIYELLAEPRGARPVALLVRACQDRALQDDDARLLREKLQAAPVLYTAELKVRGREAKTAAEDRARRQNRETRTATVEVRAATVTLRPPARPDRKLPPATVNAVLVREVDPPPGAVPVEWILITDLPINTPEQVRTIVIYYCVRWSIEVFFRVLKSGCRVEERRFEDVERVLPYLAICLTVAWRTLFVCRLGRECPDLDCEAIFEPSEWKAVWVAVHKTEPPKHAPKLATMVHLIATLGGYVERKNGEPGAQTVWIGLQRMHDLAWGWESFGPGAPIRASGDV